MENRTKFCPRCQRILDISNFHRAKKRKDGLRVTCIDCESLIWKARTESLKEQIYKKLGYVCCRCGFADKRALQIDHINGGGNQDHAETKNHQKFLKKVIADTQGLYQILCANCNWIKRIEQKEHRRPSPFTTEEIEKILESRQGRPVSEDTRKRLSDAGKGKIAWNRGVPAWNRGIPRPQELKDKLSSIASKIQSKRTPEERSQIAKARDAKMTPEQRSERSRRGSVTQAAKSPEEKAETARKSAATKKANRERRFLEQPKPSE